MKWKEVSVILGVLIVVVATQMYTSDYREMLGMYPDQDMFLLSYDSSKVELVIRAIDGNDHDFYKYTYKDGKIKIYNMSSGVDLLDSSKYIIKGYIPNPLDDTKMGYRKIVYNEKYPINVSFNETQGRAVVVQTIDYFADSLHRIKVGQLVRETEVVPRVNKDTICWYPEPSYNDTKFQVIWEHEDLNERDVSKKFSPDEISYTYGGLTISWVDAQDMVSWARQYKNGKVKIAYLSTIGQICIDPTISIDTPKNGTITINTTYLNVSFSEQVNLTTINWDDAGNFSLYLMGSYQLNRTYENISIMRSAMSYWTFDENSSTVSYDSNFTSGNNGTLEGTNGLPNWTLGAIGDALDFDGVDDFVEFPDDSTLDPGMSDFTISAWIKTTDVNKYIYNKLVGGDGNGTHILLGGGGTLRGMMHDAGSDFNILGSIVVNDTIWHHVAFVVDWSTFPAGTAYLYVDGVEDTNKAINNINDPMENTATAFIGKGFGKFFTGKIDEVAVYKRALSASEIADLYKRQLSEGQHNVSIWTTNLTGGTNMTTRFFTVDTVYAIDSCGTVITAPGVYYLTKDLTYISDHCIIIQSSDVTIDGKGYTIDGNWASGKRGVSTYNAYVVENITVKNTNFTDWDTTIYIRNTNNSLVADNSMYDFYTGIIVMNAKNNTFQNNTMTSSLVIDAFTFDAASNNTIVNNTIDATGGVTNFGIFLDVKNNTFQNNTLLGGNDAFFISDENFQGNTIYNNFFNVTNFLIYDFGIGEYVNEWNTTKGSGSNIINGPYLGGNFYAKPSGNGFSETCVDPDGDKICDTSYTLATGNVDYLPLTAVSLINACGNLSTSGTYRLITDIINYSAGPSPTSYQACINITVNDVIFDGQGHIIDGIVINDTYGYQAYGIVAMDDLSLPTVYDNITIKNTIVSNWRAGVHIHATNCIIENMTAIYMPRTDAQAINIQDGINCTVKNNIVYSGGYSGIGITITSSSDRDVYNITIKDNVVYGFGSRGIIVSGQNTSSNASNIAIVNNKVYNNLMNIDLYAHVYDVVVVNNTIYDSSDLFSGIRLYNSRNVSIYNNFLNNTVNYAEQTNVYDVAFNITKSNITNIVSGLFTGGNYWAHPNGTGFSELCGDIDIDGICDSNYTVKGPQKVDYLPLAIPPKYTIEYIFNESEWTSVGVYTDVKLSTISNWHINITNVTWWNGSTQSFVEYPLNDTTVPAGEGVLVYTNGSAMFNQTYRLNRYKNHSIQPLIESGWNLVLTPGNDELKNITEEWFTNVMWASNGTNTYINSSTTLSRINENVTITKGRSVWIWSLVNETVQMISEFNVSLYMTRIYISNHVRDQ